MANGLFFYKLVSEYPEDVTKNCKLSITEIDSNFKTLKDFDIKTAEFVRGEDTSNKSDGTLILTRNNDEKIIIPIDVTLDKNITYDLKTNIDEGRSGSTLTITYKDDEGVHTTTLENVITADNLVDVIGHDILTKVISDSSLRGLGTMSSPLGIAGIEKTGMLAPAIKVLDLTDGSELPSVAKEGTRFVTKEYVNDYGYLYNGAGVEKIKGILDDQYERDEIHKEVEDRKYYWRVPSKADWDALLDSIEPCEYRNHKTAQCHIELGKYAGKFLKSECDWTNSAYECSCTGNRPYTGCSTGSSVDDDIDAGDYVSDGINSEPDSNNVDPVGVDKYGMSIRPAGVGGYKRSTNSAFYDGFKYTSALWTTTILAPGQDTYIKVFNDDMSGVYQVAECPEPYYSVRLVKNYDGSNYRDSEYIDGVLYRCILFPESGQIWLATNFADKKGFVTLQNNEGSEIPEVLDPNGGYEIPDMRKEMFINEYNGRYWEKKVMDEGTTIVIQNPCFDNVSGETKEFCWIDTEGYENCITVEIPRVYQENPEYRVYFEEDGCDKVLKNTDDLVVERVLDVVVPLIDQERWEREKNDTILSGMIETEKEERIAADEVLSGAIDTEREERIAADEVLSGAIDTEREERIAADEVLSGAIDDLRVDLEIEIEERIAADEVLSGAIDTLREDLDAEIERAKAAEDEISGLTIDTSIDYTMDVSPTDGEYNMILKSKDGIDDHFVKIKFDGNFGEI